MTKSLTFPLAIYYVCSRWMGPLNGEPDTQKRSKWELTCARAHAMGFNVLLISPLWTGANDDGPVVPDDPDRLDAQFGQNRTTAEGLALLSSICMRHGLVLMMDLIIDRALRGGALVLARPDWYSYFVDQKRQPDLPQLRKRYACVHARDNKMPPGFMSDWTQRLLAWNQAGVAGFCCDAPQNLPAHAWRNLIDAVHETNPACGFMAWTPGLTQQQLQSIARVGFEATFSSLPWWNYRDAWLVDEDIRLRNVAPVIAMVENPYGDRIADGCSSRQEALACAHRAIWTAALTGDGLLMPMGFEDGATQPLRQALPVSSGEDLHAGPAAVTLIQAIAHANHWMAQAVIADGPLHILSSPGAPYTCLFRGDGLPYRDFNAKYDTLASILIANPDHEQGAGVDWKRLESRLPDGYGRIQPWSMNAIYQKPEDATTSAIPTAVPATLPDAIGASACLIAAAARLKSVARPSIAQRHRSASFALRAARIAIEHVTPALDNGEFPIKRTLGEPVVVQADAFMDGHDHIVVNLMWRPCDQTSWNIVAMEPEGNDRWGAVFTPERLGRHEYTIQAWKDTWASYCAELQKKSAASLNIALEVEEGRILIAAALARAKKNDAHVTESLTSLLGSIGLPQSELRLGRHKTGAAPIAQPVRSEHVAALLSAAAARAMQAGDDHPFLTTYSIKYAVTVERSAARYANWYEIFPRSQSPIEGRHGTFKDIALRLPAIRDMGFNVLYFPPIHPIGRTNRKGRNNAITADVNDPGSPYAIGLGQGGHTDILPELGTLSDFQELVASARKYGLEIALDFAIQCSPDHPWLAQHPEWFAWRADGSLRYAENPPKRYEDIVNIDFYASGATPTRQASLWRALRDVVLYWVEQGVHTFRVDNPHTKPLPFWQWLIEDVQSRWPTVVFLSEAFTRPKMMYRLAKIGFSQSYTYFTWRNTKPEIMEYLTELNERPTADAFRPNFFVNTPDINPKFLQASGRAGFLIRAALATTLSGLWGIYNGFELCEARALPGKEEYLDSEKYEIRNWDWDQPGNIIAEISQLNRIRRGNAALQTHLGLRWLTASNDQILFFSKSTPARDNVLLIAICVDPFHPQEATLELPLWEFGLPDHGQLLVDDLLAEHRFIWRGKYQHVAMTPERPYALWRVAAQRPL